MTTENDAREGLWALVHARLDARLDPLADEAIAELLLDDPEALAEVLDLTARLRRVERVAEAAPEPGASWRPLAVAAGLVLVGLVAWALRSGAEDPGGAPASSSGDRVAEAESPAPNLDPLVEVRHLQITVTTERPDARVVTRFDGERAERTVERRFDDPASPRAAGDAASVLATIQTTRSIRGTQP